MEALGRLTLLHAVLIGVLLVRRLPLISAGDALHAFVEMVLGRGTRLGFLALCIR